MTTHYNFDDNPNLPRILDTIKRDFNIDLELDYVIEQIAQCLRLIGINSYEKKELKIKAKNNQISPPCFIEDITQISFNGIPIEFNMGDTGITLSDDFNDKEIVISYNLFPTDNNGFPKIVEEVVYFACVYWVLYNYFLKRFIMGIEKGDRLQYVEQLKNRYILQAKSKWKDNEHRKTIDVMYSTFNRHKRWK